MVRSSPAHEAPETVADLQDQQRDSKQPVGHKINPTTESFEHTPPFVCVIALFYCAHILQDYPRFVKIKTTNFADPLYPPPTSPDCF